MGATTLSKTIKNRSFFWMLENMESQVWCINMVFVESPFTESLRNHTFFSTTNCVQLKTAIQEGCWWWSALGWVCPWLCQKKWVFHCHWTLGLWSETDANHRLPLIFFLKKQSSPCIIFYYYSKIPRKMKFNGFVPPPCFWPGVGCQKGSKCGINKGRGQWQGLFSTA